MPARSAGRVAHGPLNIVAIGGGTGLSSLLHGLKSYLLGPEPRLADINVTAIVTVTDDGGSSGRLRRDFDVLPPGDIRNCLVAMSEDEAMLSRLFQYRFSNGHGLKGHSFGNLFLTALTHLTGDFPQAVKFSSEVLATCGRIYPSTSSNIVLEATLEDGTKVLGESRISKSRARIREVRLAPRRCKPLPEALEAIAAADLITFGPGSLFTSVIPNLLVRGMPEAIRKSKATKAYFVNLMWQPGETIQFRASDHVMAIHDHAGGPLLDYAIVNTTSIAPRLVKRYAAQKAMPVENDIQNLRAQGLTVLAIPLAATTDVVRHDSESIASVAIRLAAESRRHRGAIARPK